MPIQVLLDGRLSQISQPKNVAQIKRFVNRCGAKIPQELLLKLEAVEDDAAAVYEVGIGHAIAQCKELLAEGVEGLHFYTLNLAKPTLNVLARIA